MQILSAHLAREFSKRVETNVIAWGRSQAFLPLFLPSAFIKTFYAVAFRGAEHVHLGDALLAPLGVLIRTAARVSVTVTVNGRDIAFDSAPYQFLVPRCLARLDRVVCVSRAIKRECIRRGVPHDRCVVIPNGADQDDVKGVAWFVSEVLPRLPKHVLYVVVGDGPERKTIEAATERRGLQTRVVLLGAVPNEDPLLRTVYGGSDVFVMPNVHVPGDFEGFGIVAIEAASAGLPVVAARVDGIEDAVLVGRTGELVAPGDADEFADRVKAYSSDEAPDREAVRLAAGEQFGWKRIGALYMTAFADARSVGPGAQ